MEWESGDVIEGPVVAGRGVGGGRGPRREQEYSKRENAVRPACRDFTYLTRNLHSSTTNEIILCVASIKSFVTLHSHMVIAPNIEDNTFLD